LLSCFGSRRVGKIGVLVIGLLAVACASSGDTLPPVSVPEPLAISGPVPARSPSRAATPIAETAPDPAHLPARRSVEPTRAPGRSRAGRVRPPAAVKLDSAAMERALTKRFAYQPLSTVLATRTRKTELVDRIAASVVYEAERNHMSPSLLAAVLLIENAPFDTTAISSQGAVGLMQVMPVHVGSYGCPSRDLHTVEANICHGARLLNSYIKRAKSLPLALTRYNGCVRGRNTPRCHRYPGRVLRIASKLRHEMLVNAAVQDAGESYGESELDLLPVATVPSQPVLDPDTSVTVTTTQATECTTFVGCLRHRWAQR
jgi:soluble lytic murein transglycosylase-like protein